MIRTVSTPTPITVAGRAAAPVAPVWKRLAQPTTEPAVFDPAITDPLPEPARRWLTHAIEPGSRLARAAVIEMCGHIRLGRWIPFRALQLHAPPAGYVWAAQARLGPLWVSGYDRYSDATGEMRWRLLSRIPVMSASGPDTDRSAAGRVALDALLVPTAWLSPAVTWRADDHPDTVTAVWHVDGQELPVTLTVAGDGRLRSLTMARWAEPAGHPWGAYPCGGELDGEIECGGIRLGRRMRAGYFYGSDEWVAGEFFRAEVTGATFI